MTTLYDELGALLDRWADAEALNGAVMIPVIPHQRPWRWFDKTKWRCPNDHVVDQPINKWTSFFGDEEEYSYCVCPECNLPMRLSFPEDAPGPLGEPKDFM